MRTGDGVGGLSSLEAELACVTVSDTLNHQRVLTDTWPRRRHGNRRQDTEDHQHH